MAWKLSKRVLVDGYSVALFEQGCRLRGVVFGIVDTGGHWTMATGMDVLTRCGLTFDGEARYVDSGIKNNTVYAEFERV